MKCFASTVAVLISSLAVQTGGCQSTNTKAISTFDGALPQPTRIVVYDFAISPEQVAMDSGVEAEVVRAASGKPRTEEELAIGRKVAEAFASKLVSQLKSDGYAVTRAPAATSTAAAADDPTNSDPATVLTIKGQFVSINEGNRTERVVIGFGIGRSDVRAAVQIAEGIPADGAASPRVQLIESMETDAKSSYKPGLVGPIIGRVGSGLMVGAGLAVGTKEFSENVDGDADRSAKQVAARVHSIYQSKGWSKQ